MSNLEETILLNEEQQAIIKKQSIEIDNLSFQISEYRQIIQELSDKIARLEKSA